MDCVFCEIINGIVPKYTIYEDEHTLAFLDIVNDVDGHTIVIPKKHVESMLDCDNDTLFQIVNTVKLLSTYYAENCGYQGVNLLNANGKAAQQSVPHFHIHIIPRKNDDGIDAWPVFDEAHESIAAMQTKLKYNKLYMNGK